MINTDSITFDSVVDCGPLSSPDNGAVTLTETLVGSTATYTCDSGYESVASTNLVCQDNGYWSGSPLCSLSEQKKLPTLLC